MLAAIYYRLKFTDAAARLLLASGLVAVLFDCYRALLARLSACLRLFRPGLGSPTSSTVGVLLVKGTFPVPKATSSGFLCLISTDENNSYCNIVYDLIEIKCAKIARKYACIALKSS